MKTVMRMVVVSAAVVFGSFQTASGSAPAPVSPAGDQSVRPTSGDIRTAVGKLMGWQVGIFTSDFPTLTFAQAATLDDALGLASIGGSSDQKVSPEIDQNLDFNLSADGITFVKQRLHELALKMPTYRVANIPADEASREKLFAFAKELGVQTIVTDAMPSSLSELDTIAGRDDVNVAIESTDSPKDLMNSIHGLSPHFGVSVNLAGWMGHGVRPVDGLAEVKDRLMVVEVRDRSGFGEEAHDVRLGTGAGELQQFFYNVGLAEPAPQEQPNACVNCGRPYGGTRPLFIALGVDPWQVTIPTAKQAGISGGSFADLWQEASDLEKVVRPAMGYRVDEDAKLIPITIADRIPADVKQKIDAALPRTAAVQPKKSRKILVVDLCPAGGYYHDTIAHANYAIQKMADLTGAYEPIFSNDLNDLKYPKIMKYDAVFLNSIVGEVFADPAVIDGLVRFVRQGGGLAAIHGTSFASPDVPEFGQMLGATSGPHRVETATLKIDDPNSPLTKQFASSPLTAAFGGRAFTYTDEFYHFLQAEPYSRKTLHVLISIDDDKTDLSMWHVRPDKDYGLVWVRKYGQGRVFNCALGHTPTFFETPALARMILNAIQFVDGDLPVDTTPSAMLTSR